MWTVVPLSLVTEAGELTEHSTVLQKSTIEVTGVSIYYIPKSEMFILFLFLNKNCEQFD